MLHRGGDNSKVILCRVELRLGSQPPLGSSECVAAIFDNFSDFLLGERHTDLTLGVGLVRPSQQQPTDASS
jgi:hypothetical protein